jgi:hypothetical protein
MLLIMLLFGANLLPESGFGIDYAPGEWESSKIVFQDNSAVPSLGLRDLEMIATGGNYPGGGASGLNAVSLIEGYAASRGLPDITDPNAPDDAADANGPQPANWMAAMFNDGTLITEQVIDDMITENNQAPYPFENGEIPSAPGTYWTDTQYPGGANQGTGLEVHDVEYITSTTIGGTTYLKGGNFPCGLIQLAFSNSTGTEMTHTLFIDLIPGDHRGYLCEPMTEM